MESSTTNPATPLASRTIAFWMIIALEVLILRNYKFFGILGLLLLALVVVFRLVSDLLRGRAEIVIVGWVLIFPLGYYFLAFPKDHQIITLDRMFVGLLLVSAFFADRYAGAQVPQLLRKSGAYWALFILFAALTIPITETFLPSLRLLLEAFLFPALLAWYVLRYFEVRRYLPVLHAVTCVMALYVAGIGMSEIVLQRDLLPLANSGMMAAGYNGEGSGDMGAGLLLRPNGPFSTSDSLALVGLLSFVFLLFLKKALSASMPVWQRILHRLGTAAALGAALMPLFKSVLVSLVAVLVVGSFYQRGRRRVLQLGAILSLGCVLVVLQLALPSVFEERADSLTSYERIAQDKQTLAVVIDHPLAGVGFANFGHAVEYGRYAASFKGAQALDSPHNNLGAVLAETGLIGFLPFFASQVLFVLAFWKLRRYNTADSKLVWEWFLFLFLSYWISGMTLATIYSEDLNLWYMFVLAVVYKFAVTSPESLSVPRNVGVKALGV